MDSDYLRRLSEKGQERIKEIQKKALEDKAIVANNERQTKWEEEWENARKAVAEMEGKLQRAANNGERKCLVYVAYESEFLRISRDRICHKHFFGPDTFENGEVRFNIPEFAQYVFNHCSRGLNRYWHAYTGGHYGGINSLYGSGYIRSALELYISW